MPTYNANIPQATDQISVSQEQLLQNFQILGSNLFNGTNISLPAITPPAASANIQIYANTSTITTQTEMFIQKPTGSTAPINQYEFTSAGYGVNGFTRLTSGILLKWGTGTSTGAIPDTLTFPTGATIPAFTAIYTIQVMVINGGGGDNNVNIAFNAPATTGFTYYATKRTAQSPPYLNGISFYYLAIGV